MDRTYHSELGIDNGLDGLRFRKLLEVVPQRELPVVPRRVGLRVDLEELEAQRERLLGVPADPDSPRQ
jgi:hypothetical protein